VLLALYRPDRGGTPRKEAGGSSLAARARARERGISRVGSVRVAVCGAREYERQNGRIEERDGGARVRSRCARGWFVQMIFHVFYGEQACERLQ
jgi:hypothetical protein